MKKFGKSSSAVGIVRESQNFSGASIYRGHHTVIFVIAQFLASYGNVFLLLLKIRSSFSETRRLIAAKFSMVIGDLL